MSQAYLRKAAITDECCQRYIYVYGNEEMGQVCVSTADGTAEIEHCIQMDKGCIGHERILLQLLKEQIKIDYPSARKVTARVKAENVALQRAFLDNGYAEACGGFELNLEATDSGDLDIKGLENIEQGAVLYLTNNRNALGLYDWINARCPAVLYSGRLSAEQLYKIRPGLIVSYNYKYIIGEDIIDFMHGNMINLHISYLPWNRGASPNIWSFIDDTPKGVTIHQMSRECDEGKLLYQKECFFCPEEETFETVYCKLNNEIIELFKSHWEEIRDGNYKLYEQKGNGSCHTLSDLKKLKEHVEFQWTDNIAVFLEKYNVWKRSERPEG